MSSQQRKDYKKVIHKYAKQLWKDLTASKVEIDEEGYVYLIDGSGQYAEKVLVAQLYPEKLLYRNILSNCENN